MKSQPGLPFFLAWLAACTVLDILLNALVHGHFAWNQLPNDFGGAIVGAAVTWFFALLFWYKSQDRF